MADIRVPKLNNNDTEYLVVEWLVEDGKPVRAGEPVAVLETSKAADELEAEEPGYLHHVAALNTWVAPGALLARITPGPDAPVLGDAAPVGEEPVAGSSLPARESVITDPARALMAELGVTAAQVEALGLPVVRRADVERLAGAAGAPSGAGLAGTGGASGLSGSNGAGGLSGLNGAGGASGLNGVDTAGGTDTADTADGTSEAGNAAGTHTLSRVQRAVARAVTTSHDTIPAAYTAMKFDVGPALERTRGLSREVRRPVGLAELFVQAVAALHPAFPLFFASIDGDRARTADAPRVGVTFDMGEGLYVPVVHDTGSLREIADTLMRYRLAATEGDFRERDLTGANIAVTLHTDADVVLAIPFVFPGTVCALAITSPQRELVLGEDGAVTTRTVANIGLAYDHRLINGRDAALFLAALRMELQ
ncbi:2-oxo acid dehydrogenase subunit E2 [Streptosporangium sp. NPDC051022]|uniref:2-oxo acid dehydrogenase subunit E2 n=1 Tax=Streptosporangium sp. NPDC051022 TaxID=3155752 RepID=UPI003437B125